MIRSLEGATWDELATAFDEAFSDYAVPMSITPAALAAMQARRGYDPRCSFGAYEAGRLVGFVFTCRDGDRIYNSGTGVVPARRRGGVARELLDAVLAAVSVPTGPRSYVLEVLTDNAKAIAFYRGAGFVETRTLQCWRYAGAGAAVATGELVAPDLDALAAGGDVEPAWQNTVASLRRATEPHVVLGDDRGAIVVFPATGDVPLLVVPRAHRRHGHGRRLLASAAARAGKPLRLMNVDARDAGIAAFLAAAGATPFVAQLEMIRRA